MKVYVAGPFSSDDPDVVAANIARAISAGIKIRDLGHHPYIPHLNFSVEDALWAVERKYSHSEWLEWDRPWLLSCDAILILSPSPGADQERIWADEAGLTVYESIDAIPTIEEV